MQHRRKMLGAGPTRARSMVDAESDLLVYYVTHPHVAHPMWHPPAAAGNDAYAAVDVWL
eukprot:COSAG02_NODE_48702_length_332_cov_0.540773_1_plen_58_part_01